MDERCSSSLTQMVTFCRTYSSVNVSVPSDDLRYFFPLLVILTWVPSKADLA